MGTWVYLEGSCCRGSNIISKFDNFEPPPRGRKVEKSKKSNIFSKINHFDLPARSRKVEKSKKINIFSKINHPPPLQEVEKSKSRKKSIYLVKTIILTTHQEVKKSKKSKYSLKSIILTSHQPAEKSKKINIFSINQSIWTPSKRSTKSRKTGKNQYF